jgi:hypothetical protein
VPDKITFVCCIEYGSLEAQTLLMLKSFRTNAGSLKNARVIAVQGRFGAKLKDSTRKELEKLKVELVIDRQLNPASWFNFSNKIVAVQIAQKLAKTDLVAWLDSDILVNREPGDLLLPEGVDFAARGEFLPPAVRGNEQTHVPYWQAICGLLGVDYDSLPLLTIDHRHETIKMYFNSGVFVWRRQSAFTQNYFNAFCKVLDSRIAQHDGNFFTADQIILGPVILKTGLKWQHLPYQCHHMTFQGQIDSAIASPNMSGSALIHYSKSLQASYRERFFARLSKETPALHAFILPELSRLDIPDTGLSKHLAFALRTLRGLRWQLYAKRIKRVAKG